MPGTKRILVVDDDSDTLLGLKEMLESPAVAIETAENKEQAMALLNNNVYDVVIADLMLDGSSPEAGLKILRYLKAHSPKTKTIVITGCGEPDIKEWAHAAGADLFYVKPVAAKILKDATWRMFS